MAIFKISSELMKIHKQYLTTNKKEQKKNIVYRRHDQGMRK